MPPALTTTPCVCVRAHCVAPPRDVVARGIDLRDVRLHPAQGAAIPGLRGGCRESGRSDGSRHVNGRTVSPRRREFLEEVAPGQIGIHRRTVLQRYGFFPPPPPPPPPSFLIQNASNEQKIQCCRHRLRLGGDGPHRRRSTPPSRRQVTAVWSSRPLSMPPNSAQRHGSPDHASHRPRGDARRSVDSRRRHHELSESARGAVHRRGANTANTSSSRSRSRLSGAKFWR